MSDSGQSTKFTDQGRQVADHWSRLAVTYEGALQSLEKQGIAATVVKPEDLHGLDMIHMGGVAATDELADMASVRAGDRVLDVGSGVGGPARRMANKYGADLWGVELSETLCETAIKLTELVGLEAQVHFKHGSALNLPFDDDEFDAVTMQHVAMQISEKKQLFSELTRVVKPGSCLALHELFAGEGEPHYPLAWATEPSMSALESISECSERLSKSAFFAGGFIDHSEDGRKLHETNIEAYNSALSRNEGAQGLSTEVVEARLRASVAMERNLRTGSLKVGMLVSRKSQ